MPLTSFSPSHRVSHLYRLRISHSEFILADTKISSSDYVQNSSYGRMFINSISAWHSMRASSVGSRVSASSSVSLPVSGIMVSVMLPFFFLYHSHRLQISQPKIIQAQILLIRFRISTLMTMIQLNTDLS